MQKFKFIIVTITFSFFLIGTSIVKNHTRVLEKKIDKMNSKIFSKEKELNEVQLDFTYLTSPAIIEMKVEKINKIQYSPMDFSKIFLDISIFMSLNNKLAIKKTSNEKKPEKK